MTLDLERKIVDAGDLDKLSPFFRTEPGRLCAEALIRITSYDRVNRLYEHSIRLTGAKFAAGCLDELGVDYLIGNSERLTQFPEGSFITVSNHPYGGLDGVMLIDLIAGICPDYRLMVNKMISRVKSLKENIISVAPLDDNHEHDSVTNTRAIRETLSHLHAGHPAGFFPSGAVSDFRLKDRHIRDRDWQENILRLIRFVKVPIVPIRFFDRNSLFFYLLGIINWKIRLLRMPSELFNKKGKKIRIGIGPVISVRDQEKYADDRSLGDFLRKSVYEMQLPDSFVPRSSLNLTSLQGQLLK